MPPPVLPMRHSIRIPLVVIAGDMPSHYYGKHPHQEVNLHADAAQSEIYRPFVKRVWRVERPDLFPEIVDKAFQLAESGRPGPVLVEVPMDIFSMEVDTALFERLTHHAKTLHKPSLDEALAEQIVRTLAEAQSPVIYAGGGVLLAKAADELRQLADHLALPVAHSLMGKGALPDDHPLTLGMTGFWGTKFVNDKCRSGRLGDRHRHPLRRGRLQLLVAGLHLQLPADEADPHRHRPERDRPQLSRRDWRRRRPEAGAHRACCGWPGGFIRRACRTRRSWAKSPRTDAISPPPTSRTCDNDGLPDEPGAHPGGRARRPCRATRSSRPTWAGTRTASASSSRSTRRAAS